MQTAKIVQIIRCWCLKVSIVVYLLIVILHPLFVWHLWSYWCMRQVILFYLPSTLLIVFWEAFFSFGAVFAFITRGNKDAQAFYLKVHFSVVYYVFFRFMHGCEVHGYENLPKGGAMLAVFHGPAIPPDAPFMMSLSYLRDGRLLGCFIDKSFFENPFLEHFFKLVGCSSGRQEFLEDLKNGHLRGVAPGGGDEAMFSKNYKLEWKSRSGFAKIAKEAGVPVVPMFTRNIQHGTLQLEFLRSETVQRWYESTKFPIILPKVYLPVKMKTCLGEPLLCGPDDQPEAFALR
ncbi:transmembrane protein 68-like, partial [Galendromus occidentalis]|uniref:Transmembrane protein 68-like n=1 Tax=Galendromus occidentalis TaxID=34638 RepID=A0AAJ7SDU2_9ACAR